MKTINVVMYDRYGEQPFFYNAEIPIAEARKIAVSGNSLYPAEGLTTMPGEYGAQGWTGLTIKPEEVRQLLGAQTTETV